MMRVGSEIYSVRWGGERGGIKVESKKSCLYCLMFLSGKYRFEKYLRSYW